MERYWHKLDFKCPKCDNETDIIEIYTSSTGEILIALYCEDCQTELSSQLSFAQTVCNSLIADLSVRKERKPIEPPIKNKDDDDFLHQLGISGGDE